MARYHESSMKVFQQGVGLKAIWCFFCGNNDKNGCFQDSICFSGTEDFWTWYFFRSWDDVVVWISTILREIYLWPSVILHRCQGEKVEQAWQEVQEMFWLFWGWVPGLKFPHGYRIISWVHMSSLYRWCGKLDHKLDLFKVIFHCLPW